MCLGIFFFCFFVLFFFFQAEDGIRDYKVTGVQTCALPISLVRRAFLWSQLDGLGYREIAERLQVSERTVKRYMAQAYEHCLLVDL